MIFSVYGPVKTLHIFDRELLDLLDDIFWMLPVFSKKQLQIIRQEKHMTNEEWQRCRD